MMRALPTWMQPTLQQQSSSKTDCSLTKTEIEIPPPNTHTPVKAAPTCSHTDIPTGKHFMCKEAREHPLPASLDDTEAASALDM